MQLHSPDPDFTHSARARTNFRLAVLTSLGFVALIWLVPLLGWGLDLQRFGIRPREWIGLPGILVAPLLHADFDHLLANSLPLVVLGTAIFHIYPRSAFRVLPAVYLGPGILVWLFARDGNHVGASGIIYGLVSFVFVAGLIRRDRRAMAGSMLVAFMYGAMAWGILPIKLGVSWETHLAAALIGALLAIALRRWDNPPPVRYSWEREEGDEDTAEDSEDGAEEHNEGEERPVPPRRQGAGPGGSPDAFGISRDVQGGDRPSRPPPSWSRRVIAAGRCCVQGKLRAHTPAGAAAPAVSAWSC